MWRKLKSFIRDNFCVRMNNPAKQPRQASWEIPGGMNQPAPMPPGYGPPQYYVPSYGQPPVYNQQQYSLVGAIPQGNYVGEASYASQSIGQPQIQQRMSYNPPNETKKKKKSSTEPKSASLSKRGAVNPSNPAPEENSESNRTSRGYWYRDIDYSAPPGCFNLIQRGSIPGLTFQQIFTK